MTTTVAASADAKAVPSPAYGRLKLFYEQFDGNRLDQLDTVYTPDVEFRDPVHTMHGALALRRYLRKMASNLTHYHMRYLDEQVGPHSAFVSWEMDYRHPRLAGGRLLTLRGITHVKFTDKVYYHEDCYDLGALLYEHVPLVGAATRLLKHRMTQ